MDGWFAGYGRDIVAVAWMGYDKPRSLGSREFGGTLALPIWIDYMRTALRGKPEMAKIAPPGVTQVDGDWSYDEYVNGDSVKSLDVEEQKSFWERMFNPGPSTEPQTQPPTQPAPGSPEDKEKKRLDELYRG
ncbi:Penicillin-binding protein 1A [compost metagenome]